MANTRFKIDNGLNVVGDSDFFGNVAVSRNVTTSNLTVTNRITIPGGDIGTLIANSSNTVSVANNTLTYNIRKIKFADTATLSAQLTDDGTTSTVSFTVSAVIPGAQGFQGVQGVQGAQGRQGSQGFQGVQGFQGRQGIQGSVGYTGFTYEYSNSIAGNPASGIFSYDSNSLPFTNISKIYINDVDKFGNNVESYLTSFDDSTNTTKGYIVLKEYSTNKTAVLQVVSLIDQSGFIEVTTTNETGTYFTDGNLVGVEFYRTGDVGTGAQGFQGRQGVQGAIGPQGFQGIQGFGAQGFQGIQGAVGVGGGVRFTYNNTNNTAVDPGAGVVRFNVNTVSGEATITELAFNDSDISSTNVKPFILSWDDTNSIPDGYIIITDNTTQKQIIFTTTASITQAGFVRVTVAYVSGTYPTNGAACKIEFARSGDSGSQGVQGFQGVQGAQGVQGTGGPSTLINATDDTTTTTLYPVFVGAAGSNQTPKATTSKIQFNAASGELKTKLRSYTENVISSSITTSYSADLSLSNIFDLTLTSSTTTITFINAPASGTAVSATLILRQPGAVSNTVTFANTISWSFSEVPTLSTGPSKLDTITVITLNGGVRYFGTVALANVAY